MRILIRLLEDSICLNLAHPMHVMLLLRCERHEHEEQHDEVLHLQQHSQLDRIYLFGTWSVCGRPEFESQLMPANNCGQ